MKPTSPFLLILAALPLLLAGCHEQPRDAAPVMTLKIPEVRPTRRYSPGVLTEAQLAACARFRAKAGTTRQAEWDAILRIGAPPIYEFKMSQEDIVSLLGEPARREMHQGKQELWFALEQTQRQAFLIITFRDGYAIMVGGTITIS